MTLKTLEHSDVRGNKLYYLVITNNRGTEYMINVGARTIDQVNKLNAEEAAPKTVADLQAEQKQKEGNK